MTGLTERKLYYEKLYANDQTTQNEMDTFLERLKTTETYSGRIENPNRPIISKEIELVMQKPFHKEKLRPDIFTDEFYQTLKEEFIPVLQKLIKNKKGCPDAKTRKRHHKRRKLQTNISYAYECNNHPQNTAK